MLLLLIPGIVFVIMLPICIIVSRARDYQAEGIRKWLWFNNGPINLVFGLATVMLCIMLLAAGISRLNAVDLSAKCIITQLTINDARIKTMNMERNPYEEAAILNTVIKINQQLAGLRYWNSNLWTSWIISDKAANIPYIK